MTRTRTKICGLTRPLDAVIAADLGADAIGLVFYDKSPRNVSVQQAEEILSALPAFITSVGLFLDPSAEHVEKISSSLSLDCLQFHGAESHEFISQFRLPYIKAIGMQGDVSVVDSMAAYPDSLGYLLDSHASGEAGGSGVTFNWDDIPSSLRSMMIVAGGITANNVGECIARIRPYAVDVSSGVESAPGLKDKEKMEKLFMAIRQADD